MKEPVATERNIRLTEVKAGTVIDSFRLKKTIVAEVGPGNPGEYVATVGVGLLSMYGIGKTKRAAIEDLVSALADTLVSLEENEPELGDSSLAELHILREFIERG
ncbi:MAG: hypothetical protein HYX79_04210 [Chloroflexi bacterium]|nr:hypothetical protein [Chloroflexota bacterium]